MRYLQITYYAGVNLAESPGTIDTQLEPIVTGKVLILTKINFLHQIQNMATNVKQLESKPKIYSADGEPF